MLGDFLGCHSIINLETHIVCYLYSEYSHINYTVLLHNLKQKSDFWISLGFTKGTVVWLCHTESV